MKQLIFGVFRSPAEDCADRLPEGLSYVRSEDLAVAFAPIEDDALLPTVPRLQAFARGVSDLHRRHVVVPFRFGCAVDSQDGLGRLLDQNRARWSELLESIEDCDEYSLHLLSGPTPVPEEHRSDAPPDGPAEPAPTDRPGTHYLRSLRLAAKPPIDAESRWAGRAEALRQGLRGYYRSSQFHAAPPPHRPPATLFLLVPRAVATDLKLAAEGLAMGRCWHVHITGPWPPFHFVTSLVSSRSV